MTIECIKVVNVDKNKLLCDPSHLNLNCLSNHFSLDTLNKRITKALTRLADAHAGLGLCCLQTPKTDFLELTTKC